MCNYTFWRMVDCVYACRPMGLVVAVAVVFVVVGQSYCARSWASRMITMGLLCSSRSKNLFGLQKSKTSALKYLCVLRSRKYRRDSGHGCILLQRKYNLLNTFCDDLGCKLNIRRHNEKKIICIFIFICSGKRILLWVFCRN